MRFFGLFLLSAAALWAGFFPPSVTTSIASVGDGTFRLQRALPHKGMSGAVIHDFNGMPALIGYAMQTDGNRAEPLDATIVTDERLPGIKTAPKAGDKVLGGYLYDNVMALVPDARTYANVTESYPSKTWFHPDLLAAFLSQEGEAVPTPELLQRFALHYQIGLFYIVKRHETVLYDPISRHVIARQAKESHAKAPKFPFFMRLEKFRTGLFSDSGEEDGNYYHVMEHFQ